MSSCVIVHMRKYVEFRETRADKILYRDIEAPLDRSATKVSFEDAEKMIAEFHDGTGYVEIMRAAFKTAGLTGLSQVPTGAFCADPYGVQSTF